MPSKLTLEGLAKKIQSIKDRFERVEKDVRSLKDLLNVHDNWHSTIRKWVGSLITVCDRSNEEVSGELKWSDRYNLCVEITPDKTTLQKVKGVSNPRTRIYTKGGINWIEKPEA
jgi:hypothetical protein